MVSASLICLHWQELHYKRELVEAVDMKRYCTLKIKHATEQCLSPWLASTSSRPTEPFELVVIPQLQKMYSTSPKEDFVQRLAELRRRFLRVSESGAPNQTAVAGLGSGEIQENKLELSAIEIQSLVRGNLVRAPGSTQDLSIKDAPAVNSVMSARHHTQTFGAKRHGTIAEVALELARAEGFLEEEAGADAACGVPPPGGTTRGETQAPELSEGTQHLLEGCLFGILEKVRLLVATGEVDLTTLDPATGRSALSLAAASGSVPCLRALLEAPGVQLDVRDKDDCVAVHQACKFWHSHVIQAMEQRSREHGADFVDLCRLQNKNGFIQWKEQSCQANTGVGHRACHRWKGCGPWPA